MFRHEMIQEFLKAMLVIICTAVYQHFVCFQFKRRLKCPHCKRRNGKLQNDNNRAIILDFSGRSEKKKKKEAEKRKKEQETREAQEHARQLIEEGDQPDFEQTVGKNVGN